MSLMWQCMGRRVAVPKTSAPSRRNVAVRVFHGRPFIHLIDGFLVRLAGAVRLLAKVDLGSSASVGAVRCGR